MFINFIFQAIDKMSGSDELPPILKLKAYRLPSELYDVYDEQYASEMQKFNIPEEFHAFTDGLMHESYINRGLLLDAIDAFKKKYPGVSLPVKFCDEAFNYRPYQQCVIS